MTVALAIGLCSHLIGCATYDEPLYLTPEQRAEPAELVTGDPAPPIIAQEWVRGDPITAYQPGTIYVVDFWSSWCGPCLASLPLLDGMVDPRGGRVVAIAMTRVEDGNSPSLIRRNARELFRPGSSVRVAIDDAGATSQAFRRGVRDTSLPRTFIIDEQGRLAWWGHPIDAEPVLESMLSGTWNLRAARQDDLDAAGQRALCNRLVQEYLSASDRGDSAAALAAATGVCSVPVDRTDGMSPPWWAWPARVRLLVSLGRSEDARAVAREASHVPGIADEPVALSDLVDALKARGEPDPSTTELRVEIARRAVALMQAQESKAPANSWELYLQQASTTRNGYVMISAADALADAGLVQEARTLLARAIERWPDEPRLVPNKKTLKARLAALGTQP